MLIGGEPKVPSIPQADKAFDKVGITDLLSLGTLGVGGFGRVDLVSHSQIRISRSAALNKRTYSSKLAHSSLSLVGLFDAILRTFGNPFALSLSVGRPS